MFWRTLLLNYSGLGNFQVHAKPSPGIQYSFTSLISEENILRTLKCTAEEVSSNPDIQERIRNDPKLSASWEMSGLSGPFETLLKNSSMGRRLFQTEGGRLGMTAVEEDRSFAASGQSQMIDDLSNMMSDPLARQMLKETGQTINSHSPKMNEVMSDVMRKVEGAPAQVQKNDLVVAMVGGFQPYIIREIDSGSAPNSETARLSSTARYEYVGDCYTHGVMDGECFVDKDSNGQDTWKTDVELVDIAIH